MFLGILDPDTLVRGPDPILLSSSKKIVSFRLLYDFSSLKNDVNVPSKINKQKNLKKLFFVDDENSRIRIH